ncbi:MAG: hypothetical protein WCL08_00135 [Verrucomicrobiota bacterium]
MKIQIPEGLKLDVAPGQTTELLTKVMVGEDGTLDLLSVDGIALPTDETEEASEEEAAPEEEMEPGLEGLISQIGSEEPAPEEAPATPEEFFAKRAKSRATNPKK